MSILLSRRGAPFGAWALLSVLVLSSVASAAVPQYSLVGSYTIPAGSGAYGGFDFLPDGRAVVMVGNEIWSQSSLNSSGFSKAGSVNPSLVNSFGASFLKVSPSGNTIAIGDGNFGAAANVLLVEAATLSPGGSSPASTIPCPNFEATWSDDSTLWVSGFGATAQLSRLNTLSLTSSTVLTDIGDGSGGIAITGGRLFTGVGFDFTPGSGDETGDIRAFDFATLSATPTPLSFSTGTLAARALSGGSLAFDPFGTLLVGGGDFSGESGFAALLDGDAINTALLGGPIATSLPPTGVRLAPAGEQYYSTRFNPVTHEVLVNAYGDPTVYRYAVPTPGALGIHALLGGLLAWRRRRG